MSSSPKFYTPVVTDENCDDNEHVVGTFSSLKQAIDGAVVYLNTLIEIPTPDSQHEIPADEPLDEENFPWEGDEEFSYEGKLTEWGQYVTDEETLRKTLQRGDAAIYEGLGLWVTIHVTELNKVYC
jgi:hypothetical protein